jgi:predicted Na+-dependent transporter
MPFMALLASKLFQLPPVFATGLCLTAAVPGGAHRSLGIFLHSYKERH